MSRCVCLPIAGTLLAAMLPIVGCRNSSNTNPEDPEQQHIRNVLKLTTEYYLANKKQPSSIDDLKNWAEKQGKGNDADFCSTRDKQTYGFSAGGMGGVQVYEQTGKGGKRYISLQGGIVLMDQEQVSNMTKRLSGQPQKGGPPGGR